MPVTINTLLERKSKGEKFAVVAAYDATSAQLIGNAGIEVILVGDSLGMVLQGQESTVPVTIDDMCYHAASVARGNQKGCLIIADMPFMTYGDSVNALDNAAELMRAGAQMVKLEGGDWLIDTVKQMSERGIPACAHLGLTPQSVHAFGGYKVQGRDDSAAQQMIQDAKALQAAGAKLLVLECIPKVLAAEISSLLSIPVIGIGAGNQTDAQVLVLQDLLGMSARLPKFVRNFLAETNSAQSALSNYHQSVLDGSFPSPEHSFD